MAKKKKSVAKKKTTKSPTAKKSPTSSPKKRAVAQSTTAKTKSPRGNSVDALLKKFEKERKTQEAKLSNSIKKIDELEFKSEKLAEQIAKLKETAKSTQTEIDQLDSRRDAEVAEVLTKLGVQLSTGQVAATPLPALTLGSRPTPEKKADDRHHKKDDRDTKTDEPKDPDDD